MIRNEPDVGCPDGCRSSSHLHNRDDDFDKEMDGVEVNMAWNWLTEIGWGMMYFGGGYYIGTISRPSDDRWYGAMFFLAFGGLFIVLGRIVENWGVGQDAKKQQQELINAKVARKK